MIYNEAWGNAKRGIPGVPADRGIRERGGGICPCVMVNGVVYYDTGYKGSLNGRCVAVDGQITSECSSSEVLTEDDQSNFGKGYDYQYGSVEGRIEIQMTDGNWYVFVTEEVKANYKP